MADDIEARIDEALADSKLNKAAKIAKLRQWEADAMARERASSEGMTPPGGHEGVELKAIEVALSALGEDAIDTGAASI
jgi:hypothetical protein